MNLDICIKCMNIKSVIIDNYTIRFSDKASFFGAVEVFDNDCMCHNPLTDKRLNELLRSPHRKFMHGHLNDHYYFFTPDILSQIKDCFTPKKSCKYYAEQLMESYYES